MYCTYHINENRTGNPKVNRKKKRRKINQKRRGGKKAKTRETYGRVVYMYVTTEKTRTEYQVKVIKTMAGSYQ